VPAGAFHPALSLLPYLLPRQFRRRQRLARAWMRDIPLRRNLTAVATLNPEFSTVEGAVESIQFRRGEQFIPDHRPFFLEGNDYFSNNHINIIGQTFYSSRIRTSISGRSSTAKLSPVDTLGFLHAIDFGNRSDLIARYRHDFSSTSYGGLSGPEERTWRQQYRCGGRAGHTLGQGGSFR